MEKRHLASGLVLNTEAVGEKTANCRWYKRPWGQTPSRQTHWVSKKDRGFQEEGRGTERSTDQTFQGKPPVTKQDNEAGHRAYGVGSTRGMWFLSNYSLGESFSLYVSHGEARKDYSLEYYEELY